MRSRTRSIAAYLVAGLIVLFLVTPVIAWAHAELTKSEPAAKSMLAKAPTEIRLWFEESVEMAMTHIVVKDSAGVAVGIGPTERAGSDTAVRAKLTGVLAPGRYTVEWRNVSTDGHPLHGSFGFTVLPSTPGSAAAVSVPDTTTSATAPALGPSGEPGPGMGSAEAPAYVVARALTFIGLLALVGAVAFRELVLPLTVTLSLAAQLVMQRRSAMLGVWAAALFLAATVARLLEQLHMIYGSHWFGGGEIHSMILDTHWGHVWMVQVVVSIVVLVALGAASQGRTIAGPIFVSGVSILAVTPALGGHAAASPELTWMVVTFDVIHVLAASVWLGTLLCIAAVGIPVALRVTGADRWATIASLVRTFSPIALVCASTVAFTGIVNWRFRVGTIPALWTSSYGQVLLVKLCFVAAVAVVGFINWRRIRPRLGTEAATVSLKKSVTAELLFGALVLVVTAVLVAMPPPRYPG